MAQELIPTSIQEEITIDYFDLFLQKRFDVSDREYLELVEDSFGTGGKFPFAGNFPNTEKGRNDQEIWLASFDKQVDALFQFVFSRSIPLGGWKWSRGGGMMKFLNDMAKNRCGVSGSLDSWNPMDIVAVQTSMEQTIMEEIEKDVIRGVDKDINKDLLNGIMVKYIKSKALLPISLKKINDNEKGMFEESDNLKSRAAKRRHKLELTYGNFKCDLEWSTVTHEWKNAQEISFSMEQPPSVLKAGVFISVQARAFGGKEPREKPQHSLAQRGAGAMLGKSPVGELEKFIKEYGVIPPHSPSSHPMMADVGKEWTLTQKKYWIDLQKDLSTKTIGGQKIDFGTPGSYGRSGLNIVFAKNAQGNKTKKKLTGFAAALESACAADELGLTTIPGGRSSGSRLTAKLWGLEWLWRYYEMSSRGTWDSFATRMMKAAKKELSDSGPFIKILGEQGRTAGQKQLRMQKLISDNPDVKPIYDPALKNKKGEIPISKMIPKNIVGYESDDPKWEKLLETLQFSSDMTESKKNTST